MAKMINKHKLKGTETRADILDKIGGSGGAAKSTSKKAKTKKEMSPKMKKKLKKHLKKLGWTPDHIDIQYKGKYGDWLK